MRFRIELAGEHSEGHEGRSALETITENARRLLVAQGFRPDHLSCVVDEPQLPQVTTTSADVVLPEGDNGQNEEEVEEEPEGVVDESFEEQVGRLYAELGSQAKVAKALGVTVYAVRRALR